MFQPQVAVTLSEFMFYLQIRAGSFGGRRLGAQRRLFCFFGQVLQHYTPLYWETPARRQDEVFISISYPQNPTLGALSNTISLALHWNTARLKDYYYQPHGLAHMLLLHHPSLSELDYLVQFYRRESERLCRCMMSGELIGFQLCFIQANTENKTLFLHRSRGETFLLAESAQVVGSGQKPG